MRKSKIILAILLLIVLVVIGIVLPYLWKSEHKAASAPASVKQSTSTEQPIKLPLLPTSILNRWMPISRKLLSGN